MPDITRLLLDDQPAPVSHYCHVVRAGHMVWVSGTIGMAADGWIPPMWARSSTSRWPIWICLKAVGGGPEHVVKVTVFLIDVDDRKRINPARQRYFGAHRPASTLVEVSALVLPELLVEIEAQAVLPG